MEHEVADGLALEEEGADGLAVDVLLGVEGGETEGEETVEHLGELVIWSSSSSPDSSSSGVS